jgi:phosphatidate cytidylyltransferase
MLKQRIMTALVSFAVLLIVLFVLPSALTKAVIGVLMLAAAWEWSGFLELKNTATRLVYAGLIGVMLGLGVLLASEVTVDIVFKVALAWWLIAMIWVFNFPTPIPKVAGWICGALVLIPAYLAIVSLYSIQPAMLLFVLVIVWAADIGAYFIGKRYGKVKLAPKISPGKTWEGVLGGLALVTVLAIVAAQWPGVDIAVLLPFCLAVAGISIIGDLTVSMFKRNVGLKDSGQLFPGHGGVLDRIDSVTAAAPLFAVGLSWMGIR